jgi:hypothetical protein
MYDGGHGEGDRSRPDRGARGLRGPGRHSVGQALGLQAKHGACLPLPRNFRRTPRPNRLLAMEPVWYEKNVREWNAKEEDQARGKQK